MILFSKPLQDQLLLSVVLKLKHLILRELNFSSQIRLFFYLAVYYVCTW